MPIYVSLLRFTEKGIQHVKDTVKRSEAFRSRAKKHGATVKEIIWTQGAHAQLGYSIDRLSHG